VDDETKRAVEEANAAFYRALESSRIERMDEVWSHEEPVRCVHPGWELITGWPRVRESWVRIFEGGQKMRVHPTEVCTQVSGEFAWVTCIENITLFNDESFDTAQAVATNLFLLRDGRWLMAHHHTSLIPMIVSEADAETIQ